MPEHIPICRNEETKSKLFSFYEKTLAMWSLPYEEVRVQTRYGDTYVIAAGSKQAASAAATPVILLHAAGTNVTMWSPNVSAQRDAMYLKETSL